MSDFGLEYDDMFVSTAELQFMKVCEKVDYWKAEAKYWEKEAKDLKNKIDKQTTDSIKHGNAMMGNFLKLALESPKGVLEKAFGEKGVVDE